MAASPDELRMALIQTLAAADPKLDAAETADRLCAVFSSPAGVLGASPEELARVGGLPSQLALTVSLMPAITRYRLREASFAAGPVRTAEHAAVLLRSAFLGEGYESCVLLSLGTDGAPLGLTRVQTGTVDEAPFYCRLAVEAALGSGGAAFVFSHNHPGGALTASGADVRATQRLLEALAAVDLPLLDHIIVAGNRFVSLRGAGTPPREEWERLSPLAGPFAGWLEVSC